MIRVGISEKEDTEIEIKGHAENNELVCAAVSGLFYALLGYLKESDCTVNELRVECGNAKVVFEGRKEEALKMFKAGIYELEKEYGEVIVTVK